MARIKWVAVKEFKLSCHNSKTILFTIYPYYGQLRLSSSTATQIKPSCFLWLGSVRWCPLLGSRSGDAPKASNSGTAPALLGAWNLHTLN